MSNFFYFSSISDMIVLIASRRSALLLYHFPPSNNFIFTIEHRFLIEFIPGLDGGNSIIFSPVNLWCSKNSQVSLYTCEGALFCINIHFTLDCEESLVNKITMVNTVQFNSINFEWFGRQFQPVSHDYLLVAFF